MLVWPQYSTRLLQKEAKGLRGTKRDTHLDRREIEPLANELTARKYRDPSAAKVGNQRTSMGSFKRSIDTGGREATLAKCLSAASCCLNANIEEDRALAGRPCAGNLRGRGRGEWGIRPAAERSARA